MNRFYQLHDLFDKILTLNVDINRAAWRIGTGLGNC